jgi:hypothetical protein
MGHEARILSRVPGFTEIVVDGPNTFDPVDQTWQPRTTCTIDNASVEA